MRYERISCSGNKRLKQSSAGDRLKDREGHRCGVQPDLAAAFGTLAVVPGALSTAICSGLPAHRCSTHSLSHGHEVTRDHLRRIGPGGGRAGDGSTQGIRPARRRGVEQAHARFSGSGAAVADARRCDQRRVWLSRSPLPRVETSQCLNTHSKCSTKKLIAQVSTNAHDLDVGGPINAQPLEPAPATANHGIKLTVLQSVHFDQNNVGHCNFPLPRQGPLPPWLGKVCVNNVRHRDLAHLTSGHSDREHATSSRVWTARR